MNAKIRWLQPNRVYEMTIRTVDRTFLFSPNHNRESPLLDADSPPRSLDPNIDVIPMPSVINIFGAAIGRALKKYPIQLHAIESNINHPHVVFSVTEVQLDNVVPFFQSTFSTIARNVNRLRKREGHVFGGKARIHVYLDEAAAEQKLLYAMTNTVKDNLIEKTARSPFFSTYRHQAHGNPLRYWFIDYDAYWAAGGNRKSTHRLKDYLRWIEWQTTPLPHHQKMTESQRQTWMKKQVKTLEDDFKKNRKEQGRTVVGEKRLKETDPRARPENPKESGREPLCHAADKELKAEFKKEWKYFKDQYIAASADYRSGILDREFPDGSFKPPLLDVAKANGP